MPAARPSKALTGIERMIRKHGGKAPFRSTELDSGAPAVRLNGQIAAHGAELTANALRAWDARLDGVPIVHLAHDLGLSIEAAKELIRQVHTAIHEDLEE